MCRRQPGQAVASPEADIGWLVDWRDRVAQGECLGTDSPAGPSSGEPEDACERLVQGFIACNLVIDLVDFFGPVLRRSPGAVVLDVTCADLDAWMSGTSVPPAAVVQLQSPEAYQERQDADPYHPWRRINHWLALDALLLRAGGRREPGAPSVSTQARRTFAEPFPPAILEPPTACQLRSPALLEAFQRWFDLTTSCLATVLEEEIWPRHEALAGAERRAQMTETLAQCLELGPLVQLIKAKNEQLRSCVARLNREQVYHPVESGWLANLSGRVYQAYQARHDFWWGRWWHRYTGSFLGRLVNSGPDSFNLGELLAWLQTHPEGETALGRAVETTTLWQISTRCPCLVPWPQLREVLDELEAVGRLVRQRGLPPNWGESMQVCDLFCHPLSDRAGPVPGVLVDSPPPCFSFNQWYNDVVVS